ncbi:HupE/UreJ family protein [Phenylobacterium sp. VNQ135]|uniref:HupE/UreJ family protein n=1 Tax=Phenylobacterium sp. VNQ135 TaxID=3400922 RepID=UPI003C12669C
MKRGLLAILTLVLAMLSGAAAAHEVRPAYLEIVETAPAEYRVSWKQPVMGDVALRLTPHLSSGWLERPPSDRYATPGFMISVWTVRAPEPLDGQTVSVEGLSGTITDVFVRVNPLGADPRETIIRPETPSYRIALKHGNAAGMLALVRLGIEHILTGPDHLLFVLGLMLIVRDRWALLKTVSAFTLAHSLTLAAAAFGLISLQPALLEALIALSILFLAPEVLRAQRGETSLAIRYPWIVAFAFGLLHGMGFAGGLMSLELEKSALLSAVVLFNLGVEFGQLAFIGMMLALAALLRPHLVRWPRIAQLAPAYVIGIAAAAWTIERSAAVFGV